MRRVLAYESPRRVEQKGTEDIDDPCEVLNQRDAEGDKQSAHDNGSTHAPCQCLVLLTSIESEPLKNHEKHKEIVDAERGLNRVAGDEFHRRYPALLDGDEARKPECKQRQHCRPKPGGFRRGT